MCVDFPAIRIYGNPLKFELEICLGRLTVYKSYWKHTRRNRCAHLVKRCVWYAGIDPSKDDEGRFSTYTCYCDLVAVLFNIEMLPEVMEALGLNEFAGGNVRDLKSYSWFRRDSDELLLDYFVNRLPFEALLGF